MKATLSINIIPEEVLSIFFQKFITGINDLSPEESLHNEHPVTNRPLQSQS